MSAVSDRLAAALSERYRIERELGQGGMATVYLAQDLKHDRKVALKVLKPELAAVLGAERFVVEIKTTAALQHPHILALFDSGTADGFLYYVMPFIQGETLREKLNRETQLGVDEAVRIATDVADALHYAHTQGVIHRDIKPENILLANGRPMVADFGIALAVSAAAGGRMTETGLSLGTPHYMSPEQATADKEISARSDIYSLASVLYEMLAGQPPHLGGSAQQIIMKIIAEPVDAVTRYRKSVPPNVAAAIANALEKLPADRFGTAQAFADALRNTAFTVTSASVPFAALGNTWKQQAAIPLVLAAALLAVVATWGWLRDQPVQRVMRTDISTGGVPVMANSDVVISPDGTMLAFAGQVGSDQAIYLRHLDGDPEFRKLAGTESVVGTPSFSPDSRWLVFRQNSGTAIMKVSVSGGAATVLARTEGSLGSFAHWGTDSQIVYSGGPSGLRRVSSSGGVTPEHLRKTVGAARYSFLLPDGSGVLYRAGSGAVSLLDFATDSSTDLVPDGHHPVYATSGHILYVASAGGLFAMPFDLRRHRVTGPPVQVLDRVAAALAQRGFSVSRDGVLVYSEGASFLSGGIGDPTLLVMKEFAGATDTLRLPRGRRLLPRFAPNGRAIAYEVFGRGGAVEKDIFTFDLVTGTNTQITFDGDNNDPVWSPDSKRIAFGRKADLQGHDDLFVKPADNSGAEQLLLAMPGDQWPTAWPDERTIVFGSEDSLRFQDLFALELGERGKATPYLNAPWSELDLQVSPDGKLAAFSSGESGSTLDIWIRDFPVATGKWRVSTTGGRVPRWSPDGKTLYFWHLGMPADSLYRVQVDRAPSVAVRTPEMVLTLDVAGAAPLHWDLHPDGRRFIVAVADRPTAVSSGVAPVARYIVVQNWFAELKRLTERR